MDKEFDWIKFIRWFSLVPRLFEIKAVFVLTSNHFRVRRAKREGERERERARERKPDHAFDVAGEAQIVVSGSDDRTLQSDDREEAQIVRSHAPHTNAPRSALDAREGVCE